MDLIIFILVLSTLIVAHELGHFLAARRLGVKVEEFAVGFGRVIFRKKFKDFVFLICAVPLGGYVRLAGESREDCKGLAYEYCSQSIGRRSQIIAAGPVFSFLLAWVLFVLVFMMGVPVPSNKIGGLLNGYPAQKAGLVKGDIITGINGVKTRNWLNILDAVKKQKAGRTLKIEITRNNKNVVLEVKPKEIAAKSIFGKEVFRPVIGITPSEETVVLRYNPLESVYRGGRSLFIYTWITLKSLFFILIGAMSFKNSVSGPLGIFFVTSKVTHLGFTAVLHFMAVLSLSLGVFNFLPLPVLDGGHLFLLLLEKIRNRPLSVKTEDFITRLGVGFILFLVVFTSYNDLARWVKAKKDNVQNGTQIEKSSKNW